MGDPEEVYAASSDLTDTGTPLVTRWIAYPGNSRLLSCENGFDHVRFLHAGETLVQPLVTEGQLLVVDA